MSSSYTRLLQFAQRADVFRAEVLRAVVVVVVAPELARKAVRQRRAQNHLAVGDVRVHRLPCGIQA